MHKNWWWLSILIIIWINVIISIPDNYLHYIQCDVGQGDAILITKGINQILIDGGRDYSNLEPCLLNYLPFWDRKIELLILTHADSDHIGSVSELIDKYKIDYVIWNNHVSADKIWKELYKKINDNKIQLLAIDKPQTVTDEQIELKFVWPNKELINRLNITSSDVNQLTRSTANKFGDNDYSLILQLFYGKHSATFTGDAPSWVEDAILDQLIPTDILKVSHHGSKTASSLEFLQKIQPIISTIGVGKNSYGHPSDDVLNKINSQNSSIYRTDQDGDIEVVFKEKLSIKLRDKKTFNILRMLFQGE